MYSVDKKQQLKDFAKAVAVPVGLTDSVKWPVRSGSVIFPVRNIMVREFIDQVKAAGVIGKPAEWRKAFDGATQIWRNSHHLVNGLLDDNVDKSEIAEKILLLLEGVAALSNNHYFEAIGRHLILNADDTDDAASVESKFEKADARELLFLSGLLWAYSETNYFVAHELTCEYHGAYKLSNGNYMVVRDFKNLKPVQLWATRKYDEMPSYIRIVTFHDATLDIRFDIYNNLYDENGTLAPSLLGGYAVADNTMLSITKVKDLIALISEKISVFSNEVNQMQKSDLAHKYLEIFWYRKKSLTDYMGVSWVPSVELFEIQDRGLIAGPPIKSAKPNSNLSPVEQLEMDFDFSDYAS